MKSNNGAGSHVNKTVRQIHREGHPIKQYEWDESIKAHRWVRNKAGGVSPSPEYQAVLDHNHKKMETNKLVADAQQALASADKEVETLQQQLAEALKKQANYSQLLNTLSKFND